MNLRMLGFKLGMTQVWKGDKLIPVTVLRMPTATVIERKNVSKHGYNAVKVGSISIPKDKLNKPASGLFKNMETGYKYLYEIRSNDEFSTDTISVEMFNKGDIVKVRGKSKGKGYAGVMERHNFSGGYKSHGSMSHRRVGSIGCRTTPGRVFKGKKLPGHLGNAYVNETKKEVVDIIPDKEIILIKGSIPGCKNSLVFVER